MVPNDVIIVQETEIRVTERNGRRLYQPNRYVQSLW